MNSVEEAEKGFPPPLCGGPFPNFRGHMGVSAFSLRLEKNPAAFLTGCLWVAMRFWTKLWDLMVRKKSICGVALQLRRCGALGSAPLSSVFARLASGAFNETIVPVTFYEFIRFIKGLKIDLTRTPENLPSPLFAKEG